MQLGPNANNNEIRQPEPGSGSDIPVMDSSETQDSQPSGWLDQFRAENSMLPNILLAVGMIVLVFLMFRSLRKTHKSNAARSNAMGTPSERIEEIRHRAQTSMDPAERLMVDAEDVARRLGAVLDNKAARLELLIEEADAKLDQLNRAMSHQSLQASTTPAPQADATSPLASATPARSIDPAFLDRARLEQDQHERDSRVAGRIEPDDSSADSEPDEVSISDQINQLAQSGKSSQEIAQELKQPIGQVELIINLQKRANQS